MMRVQPIAQGLKGSETKETQRCWRLLGHGELSDGLVGLFSGYGEIDAG